MRPVIIFGATSSVAKEIANIYASRKINLFLCARDIEETNRVRNDLIIRHNVNVSTNFFDAQSPHSYYKIIHMMKKNNVIPRSIIFCHGQMFTRDLKDFKHDDIERITNVNLTSVISILLQFYNEFKDEKLSVGIITSIAGERGKRRNLVYSASKGGLSLFLEGLRQVANISVTDIRMGFVDTRMTYGTIKSPLIIPPRNAAKGIIKALEKNKKVAYVPSFWRYIMFVIKKIPNRIYDKMSL
jgi:decaprenylphospho-beta-D-erythro-pentofuranosid-2-ulose 2-reductase